MKLLLLLLGLLLLTGYTERRIECVRERQRERERERDREGERERQRERE